MIEEHRRNTPAVASAVALLATLVLATAFVLILPGRHPVRVVAGLLLFVALPGIGFRDAFIRTSTPLASWEGMALAGALGLTASSLACLLMVAVGLSLSEISVAATCGALTTSAAVVALARDRAVSRRLVRPPGLPLLSVALGSVVLGAVIGSTAGTFEPPEYFTVFALADPAAARSAVDALADGSGEALVRLTIESHEAGIERYRLLVTGEAPYPEFSLAPSETFVFEARIHPRPSGPLEIRLFKDDVPYRLLRLGVP